MTFVEQSLFKRNKVNQAYSETVVSAFPTRWKDKWEPKFDRSDVLERIMMSLTSNATNIRTAAELAHLIVQKCSNTFFPTPEEVEPHGFLDFMRFFEMAIGDVVWNYLSY
jgi:hypothetical protein